MKITLLNIGKTNPDELNYLIQDYEIRLKRFISYESECIILPKNTGKFKPDILKKAEGDVILKKLSKADYIVLLDEKGKQLNSIEFARFLQELMNKGAGSLYFITGGAYGFSGDVYKAAQFKLSLSAMTTTHQLVRLHFTEQLYRAFTIINNHPYHNV